MSLLCAPSGINRVIIDSSCIRHNAAILKASLRPSTRMMAVVKANGYGHGLVQTAQAALKGGADALGVACIPEGAALRQAGIRAPILVLGLWPEADAAAALLHDLTLTVCSADHIRWIAQAAARQRKTAQVHLKFDTGMNRIGIRTEAEKKQVLDALRHLPDVLLTGAFTHFADADGAEAQFTQAQFAQFLRFTEDLPKDAVRHCANSAAGLRFPDMQLDMVRFGIALYGYPPVATGLPLCPAMTWRSGVTWVKEIQPGDTVSYGRRFVAPAPQRIATIPWGYGDGYHRASHGAQVLIHGQRAPIVGSICMDQMMADVTDIPGVSPGDEVILLGRQGNERLDAHQLAAAQDTISYEVLLSPSPRVTKTWLEG